MSANTSLKKSRRNAQFDRETEAIDVYYSINDVINSTIDSEKPFIISNERRKRNGEIGRYYIVFSSFELFLRNRQMYKYCHEILLDHVTTEPDPSGRLVFDFDIKSKKVPSDFTFQVEKTIHKVISKYFKNVDSDRFLFVWSTSKNTEKFSKHLTVKNLCFDNWIEMSKIFYNLFGIVWKSRYDWISPPELIDSSVVKINTCLRMVGSRKFGKDNTLTLDKPAQYTLQDSLIRIYAESDLSTEQIITHDHLRNKKCINDILGDRGMKYELDFEDDDFTAINTIILTGSKTTHNRIGKAVVVQPEYDMKVYRAALKLCNNLQGGIFEKGKINGRKMNVMRVRASKCIMSGKFHENENAFIKIFEKIDGYEIYFGCYRYCSCWDKVLIGALHKDNLKPIKKVKFELPPVIKNKSKSNQRSNLHTKPKRRTIDERIRDKKREVLEFMKATRLFNPNEDEDNSESATSESDAEKTVSTDQPESTSESNSGPDLLKRCKIRTPKSIQDKMKKYVLFDSAESESDRSAPIIVDDETVSENTMQVLQNGRFTDSICESVGKSDSETKSRSESDSSSNSTSTSYSSSADSIFDF